MEASVLVVKQITTLSDSHAPLILFYGAAGIGKTSIGLSAPNVLYVPVHPESPPSNVNAMGVDPIYDYATMMNTLRSIYKEPHGYTSICIDSLDALEPIIIAETCRRNGWKDLESPGYGKGWIENDTTWRQFIAGVDAIRRRRGIMVIWLAHAEASNHEDPGTPPYKRYSLRVHKRAEKLLTQAADAVIFVNTKTTMKELDTGFNQKTYVADGGGTRWAFCDARPAFVAKNRFGMPEAILIDKKNPWSAFEKYLIYKAPAPTKEEPELPLTNGVGPPPLSIPETVVVTESISVTLQGDDLPDVYKQ